MSLFLINTLDDPHFEGIAPANKGPIKAEVKNVVLCYICWEVYIKFIFLNIAKSY